jgi:hypothetical protein
MRRTRYVIIIFAFLMAAFMFRAASRGSHQDALFSVNIADVILLMLSGCFVGLGLLAVFRKLKLPDR